jgi:hypothetical protein
MEPRRGLKARHARGLKEEYPRGPKELQGREDGIKRKIVSDLL